MRLSTTATAFLICVAGWRAQPPLYAQELPNAPEASERGPVPVITGFVSYQSNIAQGNFDVNPAFDPVVLLPIGNRLLFQAELDMSLDVFDTGGRLGPAAVDHAFDYLQGDLFVHPNLTVVAGRYLTPFGIYRERMHPLWIRYLQAEPISFTLNATSGNGGMLRGGAHVGENTDVTYTGYYSASDKTTLLQSDKQAGFRGSVVLLKQHMEIGSSYNDTMGDAAHKMFGTDFTWLPRRVPIEIRSETLFSRQAGNTYWVEGAYRLNRLGTNRLLKYAVLVYRQEQYWMPANTGSTVVMGGTMGSLPDTDTTRSTVGAVYSLTPNLRFNAAYQGNYATAEHSHVWNMGLTYRYALP